MLDADSSGSIDYRELNKTLRKDALQAGASGGVSRNRSPLRKRSGTPAKSTSFALGDVDGDGDGQVDSDEMVAALKTALKANATRIIDLFKEWDEDGDGNVSKKEFIKALPHLGIAVDEETASTLFDAFDPDGGGDISYKELSSILHSKDDAALEASIRKASQRSAAMKKQRKPTISKADRQGGAFALRDGKMGKSTQLQGLDIDEDSDVPLAQQLRDALSKNAMRVIDLFREWDEDGDGSVSKKEFRRAMPLIGLDLPRTEIDGVFDTWDPDGSGEIGLDELNKILRRGGEVQLDASQKPGAKGAIGTQSKTRHALRRGGGAKGGGAQQALTRSLADQEGPVDATQLRDILSQNAVRVIDLFKEWDEDGDGTVSKKEFRKAIPALGVQAPRVEIDALFDSFDPDGSGSIEYAEFNKLLRKPTKDVPPEPLWKGPLLGPRSLLFVLAPNSSDKAGFCRRLAQKFGGACLSTEELAKAEVESVSDLGVEIGQACKDGATLPPKLAERLVMQACFKQRGPFVCQDWPRSLKQLQELEAATGRRGALALELKVPGRTVQYIAPAHYAALTHEFEARGKLLQLKAHSDVLSLLRTVEECLVSHRDAGAIRAKEAKAAKLAGEAAQKREARLALEAGSAAMDAARKKHAATEAAMVSLRQREQFTAYQERGALRQQRLQSKQLEVDKLERAFKRQSDPPAAVTFHAIRGPGSHMHQALQLQWGAMQKTAPQLESEGKRAVRAQYTYRGIIPVVGWRKLPTPELTSSRSLPRLPGAKSAGGFARGGSLGTLPPVRKSGTDPTAALGRTLSTDASAAPGKAAPEDSAVVRAEAEAEAGTEGSAGAEAGGSAETQAQAEVEAGAEAGAGEGEQGAEAPRIDVTSAKEEAGESVE